MEVKKVMQSKSLNGLEEGVVAMTDDEGGGVGGEGEAGTADWSVRRVAETKYCKRKGRTRSNTHAVPVLITTCRRRGVRTWSRRPTIAMVFKSQIPR